MFHVYVDDARTGPVNNAYEADWHEWIICRNIDQVKVLLQAGLVNDLDLDYDMGQGAKKTGLALTEWMIEHDCWPQGKVYVHSTHPDALNMIKLIKEYQPKK